MKKNYFKFIFIGLFAFAMKADAQCTSCTSTITGADAANHIVNSGETLCISASGTATGLITISAGGTLCNQGHITSTDLWVAGGTLNNYGTIHTNRILVSAQGVYNNYTGSTVTVDSLAVTNIYSTMNNYGTIAGFTLISRIGNSDNSSMTNSGSITIGYFGDSAAQFNNNLNASLIINYDLYNGYNSGFFNSGYLRIGQDFYNSTGSTVESDCMASVLRDWYNSAIVLGPGGSTCGGFNITGVSASSGTLGNSSTHLDLCDAGHPGTGIDGPSGTIATTTTYCTCTNVCPLPMGINEQAKESNVLIQNVYPNPANSDLTIEIKNITAEQLQIEVIGMMGRKHISNSFKSSIGDNKTTLDVSKLAQGTYILSITDAHNLQSKKIFTVVK